MKKLLIAASFITAALLTQNAFADPLKIGVVDLQQIMQKSSQIATINTQLTKEFQPRQQKIINDQKALQDEVDQLNRNTATMTETERNKLQDKIIADRSNLQGMMLSFQRDVNTAQNQAMQKFMSQLSVVVSSVAKNNNFDLVLQRAGVPYVKSELDVTAQVLEQMNKK